MILNYKIRTIKWENNVSKMIDQTILPNTYSYVEVKTIDKMYENIKKVAKEHIKLFEKLLK